MNTKQCCVDFYQNELVRVLFGDSLHPGDLSLTEKLGKKINLSKENKVLDVGCGVGTSSIFLAKKFGCTMTGIDLSAKNIKIAKYIAFEQKLESSTNFMVGDAEEFNLRDNTFDAVICECSLCLFPDKDQATKEMFRVLKKDGSLGISDVVIRGELPEEMQNALFKFICVLDAKSELEYTRILEKAGFDNIVFDDKKNEIQNLLKDVKRRIFVAELAINMGKLKLNVDIKKAKEMLKLLSECVSSGLISYTMIIAHK
jgi:ubiquinone/menaquinone biosynthesis C-methylase UbiE